MSTAIVGRTITGVRPMRYSELEAEGWEVGPFDDPPAVIELDDGAIIYPSCDSEGNGPGALFGRTPEGRSVHYAVTEVPSGSDS